jgi:1-acyl-sn-glycerol-3-phosphate acyltransferase
MRCLVIIMNLIQYPLLVAWTVLSIVLAFPMFHAWRLLSGWDMDRTARMFIWFYGRTWMEIIRPFAPVQKKGLSRDSVPSPCIFVANHLSFFDVYCMGTLPYTNFAIVVRSWPFKMLFYAPFMRAANYLNSEALNPDAFTEECRKILQRGGSILFFPEGHRSRDGRLGRFYSGAFTVATQCNVPVVPLAISGTDKLLPRGSWTMRPARICVEGLGPIYPAQFMQDDLPHVAMRKHVKERIARALSENDHVA